MLFSKPICGYFNKEMNMKSLRGIVILKRKAVNEIIFKD